MVCIVADRRPPVHEHEHLTEHIDVDMDWWITENQNSSPPSCFHHPFPFVHQSFGDIDPIHFINNSSIRSFILGTYPSIHHPHPHPLSTPPFPPYPSGVPCMFHRPTRVTPSNSVVLFLFVEECNCLSCLDPHETQLRKKQYINKAADWGLKA